MMRHFIVYKFLFVLGLWVMPLSALWAQDAREIKVGQFLKINPCKEGVSEFSSMDVYARTSAYDDCLVDTLSGEGLMEAFFSTNNIDAKRLPCSMGGYEFKIGSLQSIEDKGAIKRVALLYTKYPLTIIWVELDTAIEKGEISIE